MFLQEIPPPSTALATVRSWTHWVLENHQNFWVNHLPPTSIAKVAAMATQGILLFCLNFVWAMWWFILGVQNDTERICFVLIWKVRSLQGFAFQFEAISSTKFPGILTMHRWNFVGFTTHVNGRQDQRTLDLRHQRWSSFCSFSCRLLLGPQLSRIRFESLS